VRTAGCGFLTSCTCARKEIIDFCYETHQTVFVRFARLSGIRAGSAMSKSTASEETSDTYCVLWGKEESSCSSVLWLSKSSGGLRRLYELEVS
jgi:hypothetical protein